ncbi:MAG: IMP dehydrogenase [Gammaproteobacteria bacterium]|nr:IMP dehydrogenase [Gammaproteobacteria bacterium]
MLRIAHDALTFDDVLLLPAYSEVLPSEVCLKTRLTRDIDLNVPLMSAAMDTVTESRLAIAMAQEGGVGVIHKNMEIDRQAREVRAVKKFEHGVIRDPVTISPEKSVGELIELLRKRDISGVPVVRGEDLLGIVTSRDVRFESRMDLPVSSVMTPKERLVTVMEDANEVEVRELLHRHRIEKILVTNDRFELRGLITVKDIKKAQMYPEACKDLLGQLRVAASVGTSEDTDDRVSALVEAGVDLLVVDTAHGHSQRVLDRIGWIKQKYPNLPLVGGNVVTGDGARALVDAGVDSVKVGIGPGSICTTRVIAGIGVPQITAIAEVCESIRDTDVPGIADGGIRFSGDVAKAVCAGASVVMVGGLLAGTDEAPGEVELYQGRTYKHYRGMGSLGAMADVYGSADRYFQEPDTDPTKLVPEGVEGRVSYRGPMGNIVHQLMGGLRASMGYTGCKDMGTMRTKPRFVRVTAAALQESHVHDVSISKEPPNYPST